MRLAVSILLLVCLPLLLQEFGELAPWIAERLLKRGTRWLPTAYRNRYEQDWLGELDAIPGKITKLGFALRVLVRVPATERALTGRDVLWVLAAKRTLALLVTGLLAAIHLLLRFGDRLPHRIDKDLEQARALDRKLLRRMLAEAKATLAHEEPLVERTGSRANTEGAEVSFDELLERRRPTVSATTPLTRTSLPPRTASTLRRVGINTYGDLEKRYLREGSTGMLKIRNFGRRDLVAVVGLVTQMSLPPGQGGW